MGIDLDQYRSRIGTFCHGCGTGVCTVEVLVDFTDGFKSIGALIFIGSLLLMAGIESNPGPIDKDSKTKYFVDLLEKMCLKDRYPGGIGMKEFLAIDVGLTSGVTTFKDLPWHLLKSILLSNSKSRDELMTEALESIKPKIEYEEETDDIFETSESEMPLNPLDIFHVVIQCCDPFVQGLIYKKLFLCKIAVPFCSWYMDTQQKGISFWPLRSVMVDHCLAEYNALEVPTCLVSFARIGRPVFSKSKLVNGLVSRHGFNTFFNRECPCGTTTKTICSGFTEVFWLLSDKKDSVITVFNLRGDLDDDFDKPDMKLLQKTSDILCIFLELADILRHESLVENITRNFQMIIIVINNPTKGCKPQENYVRKIMKCENITVTTTFKNGIELSWSELTRKINSLLSVFMEKIPKDKMYPIQKRDLTAIPRYVDEEKVVYANTRSLAKRFLTNLEYIAGDNTKRNVTPAYFENSKVLGQETRKKYTSQFNEVEVVNSTIQKLQQKQIETVKPILKEFVNTLVIMKTKSVFEFQLFIAWISNYLDANMRATLPNLTRQNKQDFECLWKLQKENKDVKEIQHQLRNVEKSSASIDNALFSIHHLFREVFHVYDACLNIKTMPPGLPNIEEISDVFVELVFRGYPFELLNGEDNYMLNKWIKKILCKLHDRLNKDRVLTLSILGLQSSGKSTLLNTMFGSQFSVSSGRCTKGVHLQLLSLKSADQLPFQHLLLIDTEGIRSPELENEANKAFNHDNELATFVTGLADLTLLNIMGENMSEIAEVLQIVVHAFLRLKLANKRLELKKTCIFLHHNVADSAASDNMHKGLQKVLSTLDSMTKEAALSEGISDIERFHQIIDFDITSNIWYFPNLWQGNPPFAKVNTLYSEKVQSLRNYIIQIALAADKSYKTLEDTNTQIYDMWQGVLKENFVFSFRNSFEIKAYCWLEKMFQDIIWRTESNVMRQVQTISGRSFTRCKAVNELEVSKIEINQACDDLVVEQRSLSDKEISELFENKDFKDIVSTWKPQRDLKLNMFWEELRVKINLDISRMLKKREIELSTATMCKEHEFKLYNISKSLANKVRNENMTSKEIDAEFEKTWSIFQNDLPSQHQVKPPMHTVFERFLKNKMDKDIVYLHEWMKRQNWPVCPDLKCLKGSFGNSGIVEEDINVAVTFGGAKVKWKGKVTEVGGHIESLFSDLDVRVKNSCSTDIEIEEEQVKEFLNDIGKWIEKIQKENGRRFSLTTNFKVKLYVHACRFATKQFQAHNDIYELEHGLAAHLKRYKNEAKLRLDSMIHERSAEDTASILFVSIFENFAEDHLKKKLTQKIIDEIYQLVPRPKYYLMVEIVSDLAKAKTFNDWIMYITDAKSYVRRWIQKKSENHLFEKDNGVYFKLGEMELKSMFEDLRQAIKLSLESNQTNIRTGDWIHNVLKKIKVCVLPEELFNNMKTGFEEIKANAISDFGSLIVEKLDISEKKLNKTLTQTNEGNVRWDNKNPFDDVFYRVWGCEEICPFCREPCSNGSLHEGTPHRCIQHRPSGCNGVRDHSSKEISLTSCNYDIQSKTRHSCPCFGYACNVGKFQSCSSGWHDYKDYQKYFPNWDIAPNSNMHDSSKIWLWFMAKYKNDLKNRYELVVSNIPSSWNNITKEDAIESYRSIMSGK